MMTSLLLALLCTFLIEYSILNALLGGSRVASHPVLIALYNPSDITDAPRLYLHITQTENPVI